jgi:hypothetical protein
MSAAVTRLLDQPKVRGRLLNVVAAVPAGVKLSIPRLRDALVDQGDVVAALQHLVDQGLLDRATLRPPIKEMPSTRSKTKRSYAETKAALKAAAERPTGAQLYERMMTIAASLELAPSTVSRKAFGNSNQLASMAKGTTRPVHHSTLEKAEAWIAAAAKQEPLPPKSPAPSPAVSTITKAGPAAAELPTPIVVPRPLPTKSEQPLAQAPSETFP